MTDSTQVPSISNGNPKDHERLWLPFTALAFSMLLPISSAAWSAEDQCLQLFHNPLKKSALEPSTQPPIILNLGGEGEVPDAYNINSLIGSARDPKTIPLLVQADMRATPIANASVDVVICNKCPSQGDFRFEVAKEAFRVLKRGGPIAIWSMTGGGELWAEPLLAAGFTNVRITHGRARAEKP